MEESEKRRQRLQTFRTDADQVGHDGDEAGSSSNLCNPLLETSEVQESCTTPRFDFYTDPMAAFSSNRQRGTISISTQNPRSRFSPHGSGRSPVPMMQFPPSSGPRNLEVAQRMLQNGNPYHNSGPMNSEITPPHIDQSWNSNSLSPRIYQAGHPNLINPGPMNPGFYPSQNHWSNQRMHQVGAPYLSSGPLRSPTPWMSPHHNANIDNNNLQQWHSQTLPGFDAASGSSYYSGNSPMVSHGPSSGYNWRGSPRFSTPYQHRDYGGAGRGQGSGTFKSPNSGRSGGRGTGSYGFYLKSMVEDPWKYLDPIKWTEVNRSKVPAKHRTPQSFNESNSIKRPKVSKGFDNSSSKKSLADYLAEAFNEAVEDTAAV
ncbi:hypothetical protein Dimus_027706 [Dionaea muscipula]